MRILFVTANRVGDAVLSTGILTHLAARHPSAKFTVVAGPAAASLFRNFPQLNRLIVLQKKAYSAHWLALWRKCLSVKWDIIVDLRRSLLAYCLKAGTRYVIPKPGRDMHRVELLASTIGLEDAAPAPQLWPAVSGPPLSGDDPVLAIAPAANWIGKQWPIENYLELARRLTAVDGAMAGFKVAVFASSGERAQVTPLLEGLSADRCLDFVGVGDLSDVADNLAKCALFVGNDSGLMHMAAAVGIPTLGLFGPSRTEHYAPWGDDCDFVRTRESYDDLVGTPGYDHRTTGTLMKGLTVESAVEAAIRLKDRVEMKTR